MALEGSPVAVLTSGADAGDFHEFAQKLPTVSVTEFGAGTLPSRDFLQALPPDFTVLVVDEFEWAYEVLLIALALGAQPSVIATRDSDARQANYELLVRMSFRFAGTSGGHSLWTSDRTPQLREPAYLTKLPPELASLPVAGTGTVNLDWPGMTLGEPLRVSARSEIGIWGWAVLDLGVPLAADIFAVVRHDRSGIREYIRLRRELRPDVAAHLQSENFLMSGFRADLAPLCHRTGVHTVIVLQSDGERLFESAPLFQFTLEAQEYELAARAGLANRYLYGSGIEIGALQNPLTVSAGCRVRYIDRMLLKDLITHYPEFAELRVQAPDIVDDGQKLEHIAEASQDFVIANHFLEHCADPIRSLYNILRVLKPSGILYLAVPDKRHTFDVLRPATIYGDLKTAFLTGKRPETERLFFEWVHLAEGFPEPEARVRTAKLMAEDYSIHYNVWAASDLLTFLLSARRDFRIPFELVAAVTSENEIIVILERTAGEPPEETHA